MWWASRRGKEEGTNEEGWEDEGEEHGEEGQRGRTAGGCSEIEPSGRGSRAARQAREKNRKG